MAKKNQLIIDLGKIKLTDDQRRSMHIALHKVIAKEVKSAERANTRKQNTKEIESTRTLTRGGAGLDPSSKTANIEVTFTKVDTNDSELTATFNEQSKKITESDIITFKGLNKGDIIEIDGTSIGSTIITIDVIANPTIMNFTPGNFNDNFLIK